MYYIADKTAVCRNLHNSSNSDSRNAGQLGYKHTLRQCCARNIITCP